MSWNNRLKRARDAAGVKNTDIAKALKVSDPTVNGWMEGGTKNIEARHLLPLCKMLGVSPFWVQFEDETDTTINTLPATLNVSALDVVRLVALYAQATPVGKGVIIAAAETAEKSGTGQLPE